MSRYHIETTAPNGAAISVPIPDEFLEQLFTERAEHDAAKYERLRTAVWKWVIDASESRGYGIDVSDLQEALDRIGATCPEGLED